MDSTAYIGPDGAPRCRWCGATEEFLDYHDKEWGFPVADDQRLFEKLCLESFQSGLSWRTILAKRENFREAFDQFDIQRVLDLPLRMLKDYCRMKALYATGGKLKR